MVLKRWRDHLKTTIKTSVTLFKIRRSEASSFSTLDHCEIDDNKLSKTNTRDTEDHPWAWFWNKSANESDSNSEEEGDHGDDRDDENLGEKHSKNEEETSSKVLKQELK